MKTFGKEGETGKGTGKEGYKRERKGWSPGEWSTYRLKFPTMRGWQLEIVLVSQGCHNKLPQTWELKTTDIYFFSVLEARTPRSR